MRQIPWLDTLDNLVYLRPNLVGIMIRDRILEFVLEETIIERKLLGGNNLQKKFYARIQRKALDIRADKVAVIEYEEHNNYIYGYVKGRVFFYKSR